jgi:thiol-disulfide isomerase/thioredoxin
MKKLYTITIILFMAHTAIAQTNFTSTTDPNHPEQKMLLGAITSTLLSTDTTFKWYTDSYQYYTPDTNTVATFKQHNQLHFVLFGGTWCEDTQTILPKFFKLQQLALIPDSNITFFAVDRNKKTYGHLAQALGITNVPTIIVYKDGKEIGRVVEYGKSGKWDIELAEAIKAN